MESPAGFPAGREGESAPSSVASHSTPSPPPRPGLTPACDAGENRLERWIEVLALDAASLQHHVVATRSRRSHFRAQPGLSGHDFTAHEAPAMAPGAATSGMPQTGQ